MAGVPVTFAIGFLTSLQPPSSGSLFQAKESHKLRSLEQKRGISKTPRTYFCLILSDLTKHYWSSGG
jgi:hypothetical protein